MKIVSIVGARPQFVKLAPMSLAVTEHNRSHLSPEIEHVIIHTGQHYDYQMNNVFFDELGIPAPDLCLGIGSGTHGRQTGAMIQSLEDVLMKEKPSWVVVYGDTNSTLAGALAAAKLHMAVAHVEAGLRSYNRKMPEEINRVLTDHCTDLLFCPAENALTNLRKEGFTRIISRQRIQKTSVSRGPMKKPVFPIVIDVGDIMFDTLRTSVVIAERKSLILQNLMLRPKAYYLATIHRPENTDDPKVLEALITAFSRIHSDDRPVVFSVHPRTKKSMERFGLYEKAARSALLLDPPLSYFDMLVMEKNAAKILTDSGGVQKEAYFFRVPCITLRNETEWTETVAAKANVVVGSDPVRILKAVRTTSSRPGKLKWDIYGCGNARKLIIKSLMHFRPDGRSY
jgi:UDP-N-acetylglucosamine 2-epimerase